MGSRQFMGWARRSEAHIHPDIASIIITSEVREPFVKDCSGVFRLCCSAKVQAMVARQAGLSCLSKSEVMASWVGDWFVSGVISKLANHDEEKKGWGDEVRDDMNDLLGVMMAVLSRCLSGASGGGGSSHAVQLLRAAMSERDLVNRHHSISYVRLASQPMASSMAFGGYECIVRLCGPCCPESRSGYANILGWPWALPAL